MQKYTYIILGALAIIGSIYGLTRSSAPQQSPTATTSVDTMRDKEALPQDTMQKDVMQKDTMSNTTMTDKGATTEDATATTSMAKGSYETYSADKIARAQDGSVVLFFHAGWCPSCRGLGADIEKNMSTIPEKTSILKVDYDTSTELKKKYGVTYQHTLVQVDAQGNLIKKWSGSPSLKSLLSQIN